MSIYTRIDKLNRELKKYKEIKESLTYIERRDYLNKLGLGVYMADRLYLQKHKSSEINTRYLSIIEDFVNEKKINMEVILNGTDNRTNI